MRFSVLLSLTFLLASGHAWSHCRLPTFTRRAVMEKAVVAAVGALTSQGVPSSVDAKEIPNVTAAEEQKKRAEEIKRKQAEEKEARRVAEETKKRLAVGRIGTI